jgi:hypothetical protein
MPVDIFERLAKSKFRSSFRLNVEDKKYIAKLGLEKIELHARDFVIKRLAPQNPANDGKQTPFRGHPVFKAQHATATCCRSCLKKWHAIAKDKPLSEEDIKFIVYLIMEWVKYWRN